LFICFQSFPMFLGSREWKKQRRAFPPWVSWYERRRPRSIVMLERSPFLLVRSAFTAEYCGLVWREAAKQRLPLGAPAGAASSPSRRRHHWWSLCDCPEPPRPQRCWRCCSSRPPRGVPRRVTSRGWPQAPFRAAPDCRGL